MSNGDRVILPLEAITEACETGEVTQKELAERSGLSGQAVHNLIKRRVGRTYRNAVRCYEALLALRTERANQTRKEGNE